MGYGHSGLMYLQVGGRPGPIQIQIILFINYSPNQILSWNLTVPHRDL